MGKYQIIIFGDLPIASKVAEWILEQDELELLGGVLSNPQAHNNDPWDIPMFGEYCIENGIRLLTMEELKTEFCKGEISLGLSCRFGKIIKQDVIDLFQFGIINMHGGLLPEFAGPYSCNYSILFGNGKGGGTLHWIDSGIDTGDIIRRCEFDIISTDTAFTVFQKTQIALLENMKEVILPILHKKIKTYTNQEELKAMGYEHHYFKKGSIDEYKCINLNRVSDEELVKIVRACDFPGYEPAYFIVNGTKIYLRMNR